ncbi:hypothetical protein F2Q68_00015182 [Brassica cretica]|uniref:Uncharacterized protein n=1 Tax=Brassica cretica TaxID=69181 RepID=A0A8S9HGY9_BRACR|nr:hypothetical protein F2Q68_00015182 [Brassica cretica]
MSFEKRRVLAVFKSSANGRAESVLGPARPFAELDWSSTVNGRVESVSGPARPFAELDWSRVRLSLKHSFESFNRECVEKVSARKCDFRR